MSTSTLFARFFGQHEAVNDFYLQGLGQISGRLAVVYVLDFSITIFGHGSADPLPAMGMGAQDCFSDLLTSRDERHGHDKGFDYSLR